MRIAYILLAHTEPGYLCRLVDRLDGDHASFLIHVDRGADPSVYGFVRRQLADRPRITFLPRHRSPRMSFGLVAAPLEGIRMLAARTDTFDYAALLTGQDYPLKSNAAIIERLDRASGTCFVHAFPTEDPAQSEWPPTEIARYRHYHLWLLGRHHRIPITRDVPGDLTPYAGSQFWCLPRDAVQYIADFTQRDRRFVRFFRHVLGPDEIFFQTILMNSPFRDRVVGRTEGRSLGVHYIDWSAMGSHPKVLSLEDLPGLLATPALFARKFDPGDSALLDALDTRLGDDGTSPVFR